MFEMSAIIGVGQGYNHKTKTYTSLDGFYSWFHESDIEKCEILEIEKSYYYNLDLLLNRAFTYRGHEEDYYCFEFKNYDWNCVTYYYYSVIKNDGSFLDLNEYSVMPVYYDCNTFILAVPMYEDNQDCSLAITGVINHFDYPNGACYEVSGPINQSCMAHMARVSEALEKYGDKTVTYKDKVTYGVEYLPCAWKLYPKLKSRVETLSKLLNVSEYFEMPHALSGLDLSPPEPNDEAILIPIECKFDKRFFSKMYLLRKHNVVSRFISKGSVVNIVVPIKADNIALIHLIYHKRYHNYYWKNVQEPIGNKLVESSDQAIDIYHPVFRQLVDAVNQINKQSIGPIAQSLEIWDNLLQAMDNINKWNSRMMYYASLEVGKTFGSYNKSELCLYNMVKIFFPDAIYQYTAEWLGDQSLDIFIPSINVAVEYQGKQHYEAVEYFGGEKGFKYRAQLDEMKMNKCLENNIDLLYWHYEKSLTFKNVEEFLSPIITATPSELKLSIEKNLDSGYPANILELYSMNKIRFSSIKREGKVIVKEVVCQYDLNGNLIDTFESNVEASSETKISYKQIGKAITGYANSAGGFQWRRFKETEVEGKIDPVVKEPTNSDPISVMQINDNGEIVRVYPSVRAAARAIGIDSKGIRDVLRGKQKKAGGYFWRQDVE